MFMTQASSKGTCRQQSVQYRQWRLVSQSVDLFSHTKDEQNRTKTTEDPGDSDCERHSGVCDWRESVPHGARYISLREICGRLPGLMFRGRFGIDVGYTCFTATCKRRLDDCVPFDAVTRNGARSTTSGDSPSATVDLVPGMEKHARKCCSHLPWKYYMKMCEQHYLPLRCSATT